MSATTSRRTVRPTALGAVLALLVALIGITAGPASAAAKHDLVLRAGIACEDFRLAIDFGGGEQRVSRTLTDADGNPVRIFSGGLGFELTFTNLSNDNQLTLPANGSVMTTRVNPDGTQVVDLSGHNVLILFPTDVPAGPSTTLYVGRVTFTVDSAGVFTLQSTPPSATDLCAALA